MEPVPYYPWIATTAHTGSVTIAANTAATIYPALPTIGVPAKRYSDDPVAWLRERVDEALGWAA